MAQGLAMTVARNLKRLREARGLTQEVLARRAGCSLAYLSRLEGGRHEPTLTMLAKLAKALGVKVGRLLE
ncbi:MAG: helix-turn-helix transcriptional regulator [Candidatus Rokubacteria bacterium]|nr:helix-turn-helix transcriptional regulator [Candidatus Rokubacteria bacterium]